MVCAGLIGRGGLQLGSSWPCLPPLGKSSLWEAALAPIFKIPNTAGQRGLQELTCGLHVLTFPVFVA